jgi:hypothetical protein
MCKILHTSRLGLYEFYGFIRTVTVFDAHGMPQENQLRTFFFGNTVLSRYDVCYIEMLLITIPNLSPKHYHMMEFHAGYIDSLDNILHVLIHFLIPTVSY